LSIDRNMLEISPGKEEGEYYLETRARAGQRYVHLFYYVNPQRSLERNAWAIGQIIAKKIKKERTL
jgi:hypothetical protein